MNTCKKKRRFLNDGKIDLLIKSLSRLPAVVKVLVCFFLPVAAGSLLSSEFLMAQEVRGNLVNTSWLEKNLNNPEVLILDASPNQLYTLKHIPGAINTSLFMYGFLNMPISKIEQLYQSWGISPDKKIIIYDQGGTIFATRQFFSLYYYGFPAERLFILDGGLYKWEEVGLPVTNDTTPLPVKGTFKIGPLKEDVNAALPEFLTASGDTANNVLLEALGANWHFGELHPFDKAGHIPNAILLPSDDFYNPDRTFKSPEEIKRMLEYMGIKPEKQIYSHCGGGVSASVPFFALKCILNYPKVKLYTESQLGWLSDQRELPFWTYDAPYLMRETNWLQFWGGKMLRTYGNSSVSIVDVRPEETYHQGHVPFALNIPADIFTNNINNLSRMADIVGRAGINQSHEAVVISGAGLTKEAALAFLLLEKLGQKKISVFIDSIDKWTQLGFSLVKDTIVPELQKAQNDLSNSQANYSNNFRKDVIITDSKSTEGLYPKIFIASGINVPSKVKEGKVVHIPYTDLLDANGTPKAAKDIWNILTKAGIPRYAELVCYSDDPGEAAVNYFILRLMGYPDIKVLVI